MQATKTLIYLSHLRKNWKLLQHFSGTALVCSVIKSNAYGHGMIQVAKTLMKEGAEVFGITFAEEAKQLRRYGVNKTLLLFGPLFPQDYAQAVSLDVQPFVFEKDVIEALALEAKRQGRVIKVHLKIDTGMGRLGCPVDEAVKLARLIACQKHMEFEGICTHFASSDSPGPITVDQQIALFDDAISQIRKQGFMPRLIHAANSGAVVNYPQSVFNMVRSGLALYGYSSSSKTDSCFRPVMELMSYVTFVKEVPAGTRLSYGSYYTTQTRSKVATVYLGYADGYRRALSNSASLLINGHLYRVSGMVCMDQLLVDLGPEATVKKGDEVILFGPRPGSPTAQDLAIQAGTIPYEILCGISSRVPRIYID